MFDDRELMCIWDALSVLMIRPELANILEAELFILAIADKIEKELAERGYEFDGTCRYPGDTQ